MNTSSWKSAIGGLLLGVVLVGGLYGGYVYFNPEPEWMHDPVSETTDEGFHIHADFAVYIDGKQFDFVQEKYMTSTDVCHVATGEEHLHLHDMNGTVAHSHEAGHTWGDFFGDLNFKLATGELTTDDGTAYRNVGNKQWYYLVNGQSVPSLADYELKDLDRVLLSYGELSPALLATQMESVTSQACIYSKTCPVPEGIVLPQENCSSAIILSN
ncbi:hypothetical protein KBB08_03185 [Candidatus Gracilibacteria bacterium]|nr:hypothetical protein [Candidatus Gracilibacteria bacterium]